MIWFKRTLGEPFELRLATIAPLDGVSATAAARGVTGALWPMTVTVTDSAQGIIEIDGRGVGRVWPAGVLWLDLRLTRADRVVHSDTFGLVVLDAAASAEDALRAAAATPGLGQRRVWSQAGEVLDALCLRELGAEHHAAAVLDLNPGLAAFGPILPAGAGILLPETVTPDTAAPTVRLWGAA
jgi:phage tail protein X